MNRRDDPIDDAVVIAFLKRFAEDRERDDVGTLAQYQAQFPGFEELIATEFEALQGGADPQLRSHAAEARASGESLAETLTGSRYESLDEVGRGGMGVVMRARDRHLRRVLAMKILRSDDAPSTTPGSPASSRNLGRFLDEARITGQLAHPGIVPVHELGIDESGRLFFTMSLIEGRNLREIVALSHAGDPEWTLARVTNVLLRVCEAVAFAHSKGVIHRDLKPSNVMVGSFGETYVVDWGLARVRGANLEGRLDGDGAEPGEGDSADRTMHGDVLGTPAYMSPEQATGHVERVDARSDVYSLGAMLYHVLVGSAPFLEELGDNSSRAILARVASGPPRPIEDRSKVAPVELVAICSRAMRREPDSRYASVEELAADLRAFLDLRVVRAYETGAVAELRKWVRRNRPLAFTGAAAAALLVMGLVASLFLKSQSDQNARRAEVQAKRADSNFELANSAVDRMLTAVSLRLSDVPQAQSVRRELLGEALAFHRELASRRSDDPTARLDVVIALNQASMIHRLLGEQQASLRGAHEALETIDAIDPESVDRTRWHIERARALGAIGRSELALGHFEAAGAGMDESLLELDAAIELAPRSMRLRKRRIELVDSTANVLTRQNQHANAIEIRRRSLELAREYIAMDPDDEMGAALLRLSLHHLGTTLARTGDFDEAHTVLEEALALDISGSGATRDARAVAAATWNFAAMVRYRLGKPADACAALEQGIEAWSVLVEEYPSVPLYHSELGACHNNLSNAAPDRAEELLIVAIREHATALRMSPGSHRYETAVGQSRRTLCRLLEQAGRYEDLAERADEIGTEDPPDPKNAACFFAACVHLASADESQDAAIRTARADGYAAHMLRFLEQAAATDSAVFEDSKFDTVRERPDFVALREQIVGR